VDAFFFRELEELRHGHPVQVVEATTAGTHGPLRWFDRLAVKSLGPVE